MVRGISMNSREKIEAAFSLEGADEIPAVICYEDIFIRDHWSRLISKPGWYIESPFNKHQNLWRREAAKAIGQDWFILPIGNPDDKYLQLSIQEQNGAVFLYNKLTGSRKELKEPIISGKLVYGGKSDNLVNLPQTKEEFDLWFETFKKYDKELETKNYFSLPQQILSNWGKVLYPIHYIESPLWLCYGVWGFEEMMLKIVDNPDLVHYACKCFTENFLDYINILSRIGVKAIWIEDCMTDMINSYHFKKFNLSYLRRITEEISLLGMKSIHYFCGNPKGKEALLLDTGADAISLEESKKDFDIDIESIVEWINGKMVVLGNLDSIHILENGSEDELRAEVLRQINAGRKNGSRFIMSLGSPVTPNTPVSKVHMYCEIVHELGNL